ncbi:hypothetical protein [Vulcanisaeta souniana]|uniref:hypothetical protein n=1 Tax=Vulcanisaeta souniana TaxID=164452 RepID=UPI000AD91AD7|nr:hypothetical protein [Vulcanisaeta souniana]
MHQSDAQRLMERSSMYMFISAVAALVSVIMIIIAADFLSNDLPPAIALSTFKLSLSLN